MKIMTAEYKIGSVVKVNIEGEMTSCIIVGDFMESYGPGHYINYLDRHTFDHGWKIYAGKIILDNCYKTLIGDQIVYVEIQEMDE